MGGLWIKLSTVQDSLGIELPELFPTNFNHLFITAAIFYHVEKQTEIGLLKISQQLNV